MTDTIIRHFGPRAYPDHPPFRYPDYKSTVKRSPDHDLLRIVETLSETTGPGPAWSEIAEEDSDLTTNAGTGGEAIGQRIIVTGRVLDENGQGVPGTILEIWQANAAGRYVHWKETNLKAPLDPTSSGWVSASPMRTAVTGSPRSSRVPIRGVITPTRGDPPTSISRSSGPRWALAWLRRCTLRVTPCSGWTRCSTRRQNTHESG